ncbi:anti-sigma factor antagonist [Leptospira kobayashii]|uniref:Anti-sigma factor antagonist n=1 Tax=Leptospira kobayashii TaxID=1917830 RepID=A0ABM7USJ5_9LEPT|nr:STAS domain-containing protein [Leptospira kobayashii]BDA80110.1 anti-sigma factor antagonist [Leptospira kobayashii]
MLIHETIIDSIPVIALEGEVDLYNAKELKDILDSKIKTQQYEIVVNLAKVPFMDSSGIGTLVTAMYKLKKYHGNLKVCHVHGSVAKVFKLTGMESHLEVYADEAAAIQAIIAERDEIN